MLWSPLTEMAAISWRSGGRGIGRTPWFQGQGELRVGPKWYSRVQPPAPAISKQIISVHSTHCLSTSPRPCPPVPPVPICAIICNHNRVFPLLFPSSSTSTFKSPHTRSKQSLFFGKPLRARSPFSSLCDIHFWIFIYCIYFRDNRRDVSISSQPVCDRSAVPSKPCLCLPGSCIHHFPAKKNERALTREYQHSLLATSRYLAHQNMHILSDSWNHEYQRLDIKRTRGRYTVL